MRNAWRLIGLFVTIIAIAASAWFIADAWRGYDLRTFLTPAAMAALFAAIVLQLICAGLSALAWRGLLVDQGVAAPWRLLFGIVASTQVGKYLPGNFAHHVGRISLALGRGIAILPLASTTAVETAIVVLAGLVVGGIAMALSDANPPLAALGNPVAIGVVCGGAVFVVALAPLLRRHGRAMLRRCVPRLARWTATGALPSVPALSRAFGIYILVFLTFGVGTMLVARCLAPSDQHDPWLLVASFSLAWIAGFATPGSPAGIGVREAVMLLLLERHYSPEASAAIVLALRLATTLGDVMQLPLGIAALRSETKGLSNRAGV